MPKTVSSALPTLPYYLYPDLSKIKHQDYKRIEILAIRTEKDGDKFIARIVTSCNPAPIEMFSVYLRKHDGGAECIADFSTGPEAKSYAKTVSIKFGLVIAGLGIHQCVIRSERGFWKNNFGWLPDPKEATLFDSEFPESISPAIMANSKLVRLLDQTAFDHDPNPESTPLGWTLKEQESGWQICSPTGVVASVQKFDDANFIIRATNSHSRLIEAVESEVEWIRTGKVSGVGYDDTIMIDELMAALKQFR